MKINVIEETLLAYKRHKELIKKAEEKQYNTTPDFENVGKVLNGLVEEIKENASINEIDTILKLIDVYKTTKVFWLKEVIIDILNKGYNFDNNNYLLKGKMTEIYKEPEAPHPFTPDVPPSFPSDYIPNPTLPDSKKLNTIWCENMSNPDTNGITTNVTTSKHNK